MARLPQPGSDDGVWGNVLNQFLNVSLNSDGTIKNGSVDAGTIQDGTIVEEKLDSDLQTKINASTDPALGGDLSGTASNAQIVAGAVTTATLADGAISTAKIIDGNVTGAKLASSAVTSASLASGSVSTPKLADGSVTSAKLATSGGPASGQLLSYTGSTLAWTSPGSVPTNLDDLADVSTASAADGQSLVYQSGNWGPATVSSGGVTDHGALTGLTDDDHLQYHTDARGDVRYYTKTETNSALASKADTTDPRLSDERTPVDGSVTEPKLAASNTPTTNQILSWSGTSLTWTGAGASGEINTASNVGMAGVGLFKQKTGLDLEFKKLNAGSNKISITNDAGNDEVDIDVNTANLGVTKSDVGLANVDNTSDANKPISTATQTTLNTKSNTSHTHTLDALSDVDTSGVTSGGILKYNGTSWIAGTDNAGSADPTLGGDLSGTASNAQIIAGAVASNELATDAVTTLKITDLNVTTAKLANASVTDAKVVSGIAQSKITNLTSDLAGKEPFIPAGTTADYRRGDKTWQPLNKAAVGLANVDNTSDANKPISTATQSALNLKLDKKNDVVALTDSTNDQFVRINITDDASPTSGWTDRLAFYFSGTRTGYHNEYGELRARPAKINTIAFRALQWNGASTVDIFQVTNSSQSTVYFGVGPTAVTASVPLNSTANIATTGTVTGSNIGNKVTTSSTAPSSPSIGDVWVDTST